MNELKESLNDFLFSLGLESATADVVEKTIIILVIIALAFFIEKVCIRVLLNVIQKLVKKTKANWDDILFSREVIGKLFGMIAPILVDISIPIVFEGGSDGAIIAHRLCTIYIIAIFARFLNSLFSAFYTIYNAKPEFRDRPLKGILQTIQVIVYFIAGIMIVSTLLDKEATMLLTGLGASAAVLMLVFQDSILGFVSGVQLSANGMLRVGDWIEMPKYGVDGDVLEVSLNTVKVQNWDKTIVTIPPTLLMKDSFKNWRGMVDSGGRRVKRSVFIDMNSVTFCTPEMLERYRKIQFIAQYIDEKEKELSDYNKEHGIDNSMIVNGRRQTNLGVFRAYLSNYLKLHPSVNHEMTCMVRQLQPTELGLPLELYFFTNTTAWVLYEGIQADVFDHVLAVASFFDLNVFQNPSGKDFGKLAH